MYFLEPPLIGTDPSEQKVWECIKDAFGGEAGAAALRPAISQGWLKKDLEPDLLMIWQEVGVVVIEVKSFPIDMILKVENRRMSLRQGSYAKHSDPFRQARTQAFAFKNHLSREGIKADVLPIVAFPKIRRHEWIERGFQPKFSPENILFMDDLYPDFLLSKIKTLGKPYKNLTSEQLDRAIGYLRGAHRPQVIPKPKPLRRWLVTLSRWGGSVSSTQLAPTMAQIPQKAHQETLTPEQEIQHLEAADNWQEAAKAWTALGRLPQAAMAYESGCLWQEAAKMWAHLGEWEALWRVAQRPRAEHWQGFALEKLGRPNEAAERFEAQGEWQKALKLYQQLGNNLGEGRCQQALGDYGAAGTSFWKGGDAFQAHQAYTLAERHIMAFEMAKCLGSINLGVQSAISASKYFESRGRKTEAYQWMGHAKALQEHGNWEHSQPKPLPDQSVPIEKRSLLLPISGAIALVSFMALAWKFL